MQKNIYTRVSTYSRSKPLRRTIEIAVTLLSTIALVAAAYFVFMYSPMLSILFTLPLSLFMVRCFIIQHDCSHGALFKKRSHNQWLGRLMSLLTFTPFTFWRWSHMVHHKHNANLDKRGIGDIYMLTTKEYQESTKFQKCLYRLSRYPAIMLFILAPLYFLGIMRFNFNYYTKAPDYKRSATNSIYLTNIALVLFYGSLCYLLSYPFVLLVLLPAFLMAAVIGTWLFYVQHTFPDSYFERENNGWDHLTASLEGSSYYKLPWVLEWLTGYIGYHHIHHFNAKIPFYRLKEAFKNIEEFQSPKTYGLKDSIILAKLVLYDENVGRFITWKQYCQSLKIQY